MPRSQYGAVPILILVSLVGIGLFIFTSVFFSFQSTLFTHLFEKPPAQAAGNIQVVFNDVVQPLSPLAIGLDESGYGGDVLTIDPLQRSRLQALKLGAMRMELKYERPGDSSSRIVCGGGGCHTSATGSEWISAIKSIGAEPILIVPLDGRHDVSIDRTDAVNLVRYFNKTTNNPVKRWIIGNETDNGGNPATMTATEYANRFNILYDAMKAEDPTIKIGGPATAYFNRGYLQTFLNISGTRTDFVDYHGYGTGGSDGKTDAQLMAVTSDHYNNIIELKGMINQTIPNRFNQIEVQIGEWNCSWSADPRCYLHFNTVWSASQLGQILKAGGIALPYADKNGALGALYEWPDTTRNAQKDDPMPLYHGIGMFTGESLPGFPRFGNALVHATTSLTGVEVYASQNPQMIVVVNKLPTENWTGVFDVFSASGTTVEVWRKDTTMNPIAPPSKLASATIQNNSFTYLLPAYSVTTFVITGSSSSPTPSPQPTAEGCTGDGIYLYTGANFTDTCMKLTADLTSLVGTTVGNDTVQSVRVVGPYTATLFVDSNYQGTALSVTQSIADLLGTSVGRFSVSSVRVQQVLATPTPGTTTCSGDGVYLYVDAEYQGNCTKLTADTANLTGTAVGGDSASSVRLVGSYQATLFRETNFGGVSQVVTQNIPNLAGSTVGNDAVSSVRVTQVATLPGDANNDRKVDIFDYNIIVRDFNCGVTRTCATPIPGDVDKNNVVTIFDYNLVVANFGRTS